MLYLASFTNIGLDLPLVFVCFPHVCDLSISSSLTSICICSWNILIATPLVTSSCFSGTPWIKIQLHLEHCSCWLILFSSLPSWSFITLALYCNSLMMISSFFSLYFSFSSNLWLKHFIDLLILVSSSSSLIIQLFFVFSDSRKTFICTWHVIDCLIL